jgi:hypothetical protein
MFSLFFRLFLFLRDYSGFITSFVKSTKKGDFPEKLSYFFFELEFVFEVCLFLAKVPSFCCSGEN